MKIHGNEQIVVKTDGAIPLINSICDKISLAERIDAQIEEEQCKRIVTSGVAIKALVMSIVARRKALYKVERFYESTDTEKIFGDGIQAEHFTDDMLARALDDLYDIGAKKIMTETAMKIIQEYKIPVTSIHADTTSKSLYGEYKNQNEEDKTILITQGHSKDYRPDLKQILFGLGTTKDRIIVTGNVCDGNTSDKDWNKDILKELRNSMKQYGLRDFVYVADSVAITEEMLKSLRGKATEEPAIPFVSRLPGNYKLEQQLKSKALSSPYNWIDIGRISDKKESANYRIQCIEDELYNNKYRFLVCHSDHLSTRKDKTISKRIETEEEEATKAIKKLCKTEYYCEADANEAYQMLGKELNLKYHDFFATVVKVERSKKRTKAGSSNKNEALFRLKIEIYKDDVRIREIKEKESIFVLITSIDENEMDGKSILTEYKQQSSVETSFRVLKDPYFIDELFIKKPHRVEALAYVMLLALMILTLFERTVRENLKNETERIVIAGGVKTFTPTGASLIETLDQIQVILIYKEGKWQRHCELKENEKRILMLVGFDESIYTQGFQKNA